MRALTGAVGAALFVMGLTLAAQQSPPKPLTNADVIALAKAGLGDQVILAKIHQATQTSFDTSTDALVALKRAGVSDAVLAAMMTAASGGTAEVASSPRSPGATATANSDDPGELASGIYIDVAGGGGASKWVPLEPTVISSVKTSGGLGSMFTMGISKVSLVASVRGARANQRTTTQRPSFHFSFRNKSTDLGESPFVGWLAGASSPNEFVLMQMYAKSDHRELVVGKGNAFGTSAGVEDKNVVPIKIDRLGPGNYDVVPTEDLGHGEFCFFYAAGASSLGNNVAAKLFDFGVD